MSVREREPSVLWIEGGQRIGGTVGVDSSKNAALPLLAAAATVPGVVELQRVPACTDVTTMRRLLRQAGWLLTESGQTLRIGEPKAAQSTPELAESALIRASYYLVPPLLRIYGRARLAWPGGCAIGHRDMDLHFAVYQAFGDAVETDAEGYTVTAATMPKRVELALPYRSRGATIAAILRAVAGSTAVTIYGPNTSPESKTTVEALAKAGYDVELTPERLRFVPASELPKDARWEVPGDKIEAGTLACAIAATDGFGFITGVQGTHLETFTAVLRDGGVRATVHEDGIQVHGRRSGGGIAAIASLEVRGLDADFEPPLMALGLTLPGRHQFEDSINPGRHGNLLPQLARLGAVVDQLTATSAALTGPQSLSGARVHATDIRTGAALLIAALAADGITALTGLEQVRRGYASLPGKLIRLGAQIKETA